MQSTATRAAARAALRAPSSMNAPPRTPVFPSLDATSPETPASSRHAARVANVAPLRTRDTSSWLADGCELLRATSQSATTLVLGALTARLGGAFGAAIGGRGMTTMSLSSSVFGALIACRPSTLAVVGAALVATSSAAGLVVARHDAVVGKRAAADARRSLLAASLADPLRADATTLGAAVAWPQAIEAEALGARARRRAFLQLAAAGAAIAIVDPILAALVLAMVAPFALSLATVRRRLRARAADGACQLAEVVAALRDLLEHAPLWAVSGGGPVALARLDALSSSSVRLARRTSTAASLAAAWNELLAALAICFLVATFGPEGLHARPTLVPVIVAMVSAYRPLRDLTEAAPARAAGVAARSALAAWTSAAPRTVATTIATGGALRAIGAALDVGGAEVRRGVDFAAVPGDIVALEGPPGAGKSALLEAIAGVRPLVAGRLEHGEERLDVRGVGPAARALAWAPASAAVLPGTVDENLAPDAPRDQARLSRARAILRATGGDALAALAGDLLLGPGGRRLSAGEAQRIALARALATDTPLLLLDEPSANLDDASERAVATAIVEAAARGAIVVVASHRPALRAVATQRLSLGVDAVRL
jgi:ABC-type multidrug transport system fused ATPase/permease subunit